MEGLVEHIHPILGKVSRIKEVGAIADPQSQTLVNRAPCRIVRDLDRSSAGSPSGNQAVFSRENEYRFWPARNNEVRGVVEDLPGYRTGSASTSIGNGD